MDDRTTMKGRRGPRRATNVSLPASLLAETRQLDSNICEASETGLRERVSAARRERWLEQNREAIEDYNARIDRDGLTLARYRQF